VAQKVFSPGSGREQGGVRGRAEGREGVRSQEDKGQVGVRGGWETRLIRVLEGSRLLDFAAL